MKVLNIFNHKNNSQMLLKIQNEKQLKTIASLIAKNEDAKRVFTDKKIMTALDLQSVYDENVFFVSFENDCIDFISKATNDKVYSYAPELNALREYNSNDNALDDVFCIHGDQSLPEFNDDEIEAAERLFLTLCGADLSNGWMSEDVFGYKERHPKYSLAVFGE